MLKCQALLRAGAQTIASPPVQKPCFNEGVLTLHGLIGRIDLACPTPHRLPVIVSPQKWHLYPVITKLLAEESFAYKGHLLRRK